MLPTNDPPLHGAKMREAIESLDTSLDVIASELIIAGECTMVTAPPGKGKTTLGLQATFHISAGTPVFGILDVPRPVGVYYVAFETNNKRFVDKRRRMKAAVPCNEDLIWFDTKCIGLNVSDHMHCRLFINRVKEAGPLVKVIVIDPAYKTVAGGLSKDAEGNAFTRFLSMLSDETGCALLVFHHTHRELWQNGKLVTESNPIFGSQWLVAHPSIMWNIEPWEGGTKWTLTKDREGICRKEIKLNYDEVTGASFSPGAASEVNLIGRLVTLLKTFPRNAQHTTTDLATMLGCSAGSLRNRLNEPELQQLVEFIRPEGKPTIWKIK